MKPVSERLTSHPVCAPDKDKDVRLNSFCFSKIYHSFEMGNEVELLTRREAHFPLLDKTSKQTTKITIKTISRQKKQSIFKSTLNAEYRSVKKPAIMELTSREQRRLDQNFFKISTYKK